jgi:hypothetical protein
LIKLPMKKASHERPPVSRAIKVRHAPIRSLVKLFRVGAKIRPAFSLALGIDPAGDPEVRSVGHLAETRLSVASASDLT